ncbi:Iron-sulfur cluster carrier protein [Metallosphaera sp. J1]|uniref:P-loop NTPase n=1 Tax=Metallosphaera javensis (ex Hofmann et al. 2022) TaxID=99938 RepID=UPI001EDF96E1|nr:P-loop NTPase [Metallosphaera javensis (ex Hofmann et al. 2022)]MCG3108322.1 Iron-sulfur cluster carrier protein [Metallosphaera javensis (ex Hofmann et al. 2022)]
MRIPVLSVKGGIGKSIISFLLSRELALRGEKVILLDRDQIGFSSSLAGLEEKGLLASVVDGEKCQCISHLKIGKGEVNVIKLYGDGPRLKRDLDALIKYPELGEEYSSRYASILKTTNHSHIIIDNPALSLPSDVGNKLEMATYLSMFPGSSSLRLLITDITVHHLDNTLKYIGLLDAGIKQIPSANVQMQYLAINMAPPDWDIKSLHNLSTKMAQGRISNVFVFPFKEELFQFSGTSEDLPRFSQIETLAKNVIQKRV